MNRRAFFLTAVVSLVGGLFAAESFAETSPGLKYSPAPPSVAVMESLCGIEGQILLDPNDHTDGFLNYKGVVTFTAKQELAGVNLRLTGPKYLCTCLNCPSGSSNLQGVQLGSSFAAGEKRSYAIECGSAPKPTDGNAGRATIEHFVASKSDPKTGMWVNASCGGSFTFLQKPPAPVSPSKR